VPALATGPARLARACVVAVSTVALGMLAHVLGGGAVPPTPVLGALAAVLLAGAVPLSGRRIGPVGAVAFLGVGQLAVHTTLGAVTSMGCAPALMEHGHATAVACGPAGPAMGVPLLGASAMLVLHVVATLVTGLLIAGTDRAIAWIRTWLRPLLDAFATTVVVAVAPLPTPVAVTRAVGRTARGVVLQRGPPMATRRLA